MRPSTHHRVTYMDSGVLIEAIVNACADSGKEFMHSSVLAITLIKDTATTVLGDVNKVRHAVVQTTTRRCVVCPFCTISSLACVLSATNRHILLD